MTTLSRCSSLLGVPWPCVGGTGAVARTLARRDPVVAGARDPGRGPRARRCSMLWLSASGGLRARLLGLAVGDLGVAARTWSVWPLWDGARGRRCIASPVLVARGFLRLRRAVARRRGGPSGRPATSRGRERGRRSALRPSVWRSEQVLRRRRRRRSCSRRSRCRCVSWLGAWCSLGCRCLTERTLDSARGRVVVALARDRRALLLAGACAARFAGSVGTAASRSVILVARSGCRGTTCYVGQ